VHFACPNKIYYSISKNPNSAEPKFGRTPNTPPSLLLATSVSHFGHQYVPETYPETHPARTSTYQRPTRDLPERIQCGMPLDQYISALVQHGSRDILSVPSALQTCSRGVTSVPEGHQSSSRGSVSLPVQFQVVQSSSTEVTNSSCGCIVDGITRSVCFF